MYIYIDRHIDMCIYVCTYISISIDIYLPISIYLSIYLYLYLYMYIHICLVAQVVEARVGWRERPSPVEQDRPLRRGAVRDENLFMEDTVGGVRCESNYTRYSSGSDKRWPRLLLLLLPLLLLLLRR